MGLSFLRGSAPSSLNEAGSVMPGEHMMLDSMAGISDLPGSSSFDYNQTFWTNMMQAGAFGGFWEDSNYIVQHE